MRTLTLLFIATSFTICCREPAAPIENIQPDSAPYTPNSSNEAGGAFEVKVDRKELAEESACQFKDGRYPASVKYFNPKTEHAKTHELFVRVRQCKVVQIDFPNGGWLDENHIPATPITKEGGASLTDDKGRIWQVQINKKKDD